MFKNKFHFVFKISFEQFKNPKFVSIVFSNLFQIFFQFFNFFVKTSFHFFQFVFKFVFKHFFKNKATTPSFFFQLVFIFFKFVFNIFFNLWEGYEIPTNLTLCTRFLISALEPTPPQAVKAPDIHSSHKQWWRGLLLCMARYDR